MNEPKMYLIMKGQCVIQQILEEENVNLTYLNNG